MEQRNGYEKQCAEEMEKLMEQISPIFATSSGREQAKNYIIGLMSPIERKNGWQMAESLGQRTPYAIQQFLYRGQWSADEMRDCMRRYVSERIGEPDAVMVVDETGFLKQGKKSCGVMRQYSGTAGRVENCQIGVFLTYASSRGYTMLDRRLYLPKEWAEDQERRRAAGVPEGIQFQTKPQMALEMIQEAVKAGVPFTWVTGDSIYGDFRDIRMWLESQGKRYVLCVSGKEHVWIGLKQHRVNSLLESIPAEGWMRESAGAGSKGERLYDWTLLRLNPPPIAGWARWLLVRRSIDKPDVLRAYVCCAPEDTPMQTLIRIAGTRWTVETCFAESKGQVGLDQYEVRSYAGWYKYISLACLAHALLTVLKAACTVLPSSPVPKPTNSSFEAFKKGRGL